eukprot:snap_masked-scaffold_22-processed-gene-5.20-mRNA-1 protein AED:1.00 eAED:1.00 QI:0/0/0/0/1/1/2/0/69
MILLFILFTNIAMGSYLVFKQILFYLMVWFDVTIISTQKTVDGKDRILALTKGVKNKCVKPFITYIPFA